MYKLMIRTYRCMIRIMPTPTLEEDKQGLLTSITSSTIFSRISSKLNVCPRNRAIKSEWLWFSFSFFLLLFSIIAG